MNYAGATKAPIQSTSVCTQTDVSWVGAQPVSREQRPAASVTSSSVATITHVADVKKPVPLLSHHLRRKIQNIANLLHQRFHLFMSLMRILLLKTIKGKTEEFSYYKCANLPNSVLDLCIEQRLTEDIWSVFRFFICCCCCRPTPPCLFGGVFP